MWFSEFVRSLVSSFVARRYWGTQRVARVCQVSPATVASWVDQGLLKGHKTPTGRRRVQTDDLVAFLRAHSMVVPPELEQGDRTPRVVVVEDDPGYLRALVRTIEKCARSRSRISGWRWWRRRTAWTGCSRSGGCNPR
ncbi:MAG: hypothetical protein DMD36_02915 [Gemmatimonadetes bacterium]|nr:MAG: hypothetical protein DMD36_02915 [Gemmatimonadota bacterium]